VDRLLPVPIKHDFGKIQALKSGILGKGSVQRVGLPTILGIYGRAQAFGQFVCPKVFIRGKRQAVSEAFLNYLGIRAEEFLVCPKLSIKDKCQALFCKEPGKLGKYKIK